MKYDCWIQSNWSFLTCTSYLQKAKTEGVKNIYIYTDTHTHTHRKTTKRDKIQNEEWGIMIHFRFQQSRRLGRLRICFQKSYQFVLSKWAGSLERATDGSKEARMYTEGDWLERRWTRWGIALCREGVPGGSDGKELTCNARDLGLIPGSGRSPGGGNGNPLQYFCLENPMDRGAWQSTVHGVTKSRTRLRD